jgi:ribosome-binding ATPase
MASLEIGIVGLPNVGKTTLFNALTGQRAAVTDFAATTASANVGVAPVPDPRLVVLRDLYDSREIVPATIQLKDVSGLVVGAGRGGGLAGEFLTHLRSADALIHVVRSFPDDSVFHVDGRVDPVADAEAVDLELVLADHAVVEKRRERTERRGRTGDKEARAEVVALDALLAHLDEGQPVRTFGGEYPDDLDLLTSKPLLYVANTSDDGDPAAVEALRAYAAPTEVVPIAALFEAELADLDDDEERSAFLAEIGQEEAGLPRVAAAAFRLLELNQFFTAGPKEIHAWPLRRGSTAVAAAAKIHTDIARGFIRAEVIATTDLVDAGSEAEVGRRGRQRVEGKGYVVEDGDIINIRTSA